MPNNELAEGAGFASVAWEPRDLTTDRAEAGQEERAGAEENSSPTAQDERLSCLRSCLCWETSHAFLPAGRRGTGATFLAVSVDVSYAHAL